MEAAPTPTGDDRALATAASLSELRGRVDSALASYRRNLCEVEREIGLHADAACAEHGAELESHAAELSAKAAEIDELRAKLMEAQGDTERLAGELTIARSDADSALDELNAARDELTSERELPCEECEKQRQELEEARESLECTHADLEQLRAKNEAICQSLGELKDQVRTHSQVQEELADAERKFELALSDVDRLKQENASLVEELRLRPEPDEGQARELVGLRAEREDLLAEVEQLRQHVAVSQHTGDQEQELADLQRRFEMAVDEVRELKDENSDLREKLASGEVSGGGGMVDLPAGDDWQAQKARLLASLAAEDGEVAPPERRQERANIEETITATDRALSQKDQEIAELREQLSNPDAAVDAAEREALQHTLDESEVIQKERERLELLQTDLLDKLRQAELEISIERAKVARERAAMEERIAELEATVEGGSGGGGSEPGKPKRRWLSALGIGDEGEAEESA